MTKHNNRKTSNWISVDDKRPRQWERILLQVWLIEYEFPVVRVGCLHNTEKDVWKIEGKKEKSYVSHWQSFPDPTMENCK